ncbi:polyamine-transporting ATPase 13A3 [Tribolium castaneum]|uniref:Cation-transporting ATPase n=1 Tax=Tribolium castaneum TaxID=7070 RepID=A0A139WGX1_TRICA|nr:PREDICTED: probable cation-transporting ATPase 13A3 [Tribolium castaneum]KYB27139.1 putative cation-transporting ATPase 13A3-like Protein [Tribolium castaneum]|eukprot:XP_008194528.1 PREDICTED: probable cation-transporting ATPase 13A3 [Tribolium castaneum]
MVKEFGGQSKTTRNGITSKNNGTVSNNKTKTHYLNFGEEDQMEISGYTSNHLKKCITWTVYVLTFGILRLIFHWYPQWQLYASHSKCPLGRAEKVLITDKYKNKFKTYFVKDVEILTSSNELRKTESIISINGLIFKNETEGHLLDVYLDDGTRKRLTQVRIVRCKKLTYIWDEEKYKFIKLSGLDKGIACREFHEQKGYKKEEQNRRRITYGTNEINVPVQSIVTLLVLEALTPFYIFQLFSLIVWFAEAYYYYTIAIVIMSVFGISTSIIQTRKSQENLKGTVHTADKIMVSRSDGTFDEIPTTELVPGDVIVIPSHGCDMQCDAVLLNGNCIVNESMLTGESVPVTKTALPNNDKLYNVKEHGNHTLFCGTKIIQTRYYGTEPVLAVVIRTGYLTTKGQLVRSIIYPPPADFKFDQDSYKFIMILSVIALLGFFYTIFSKYSRDIAPLDILIKALDLVTIAIPPALPAAMTVGKLYALNRLKKKHIYCINSRVINVSGSVDCVCFDKTGTLTEDGLDMWGVVPVEDSRIEKPVKEIKTMSKNSLLFRGMLTCHSLTLIDGELCGDPLDIKMFESTGWTLEEPTISDTSKYDLLVPTILKDPSPDTPHHEIGLIHQFQFSSTLQRMSVICRTLGSDHFESFTKGSPEMVISLSRPETVPEGILNRLKTYTEQGYRVIGMATKKLTNIPFHKIPKLQREEIECDLQFVGLIVLENRLKPQTGSVIQKLRNAGMKIVMVTGDNIQTAVSVARDCGIIQSGYSVIDVITTKPTKTDMATVKYQETDATPSGDKMSDIEKMAERRYHFVVTGNTWTDLNRYFPELIPKIVTKGVVFARMSGLQKQQLVEELQNLGYYVAMCGDGANDCGALKAANVGISLSEAESSVASPFTSQEPNISCTVEVIKEGRAALVTSFGVFKLMLCYSLTEFASVIILYAIDTNLTSLQFLFIDICLILNFASFFGKTRAYDELHRGPPMTSLLSFVPLASIILFMLVTVAVQIFAYYYIQTYDWFVPFVFDPNDTTMYRCYENYAVYCVSMFQYIIMAVVFSKGKPYRKAIYTNFIFLFAIFLMIGVCSYITLDPVAWVIEALELQMPPFYDGRVAILVMALVNFLICVVIEDVFVDVLLFRFVRPKFRILEKSRQIYLKIEKELREDPTWPTKCHSVSYGEIKEGGIVNNGFCNHTETTKC